MLETMIAMGIACVAFFLLLLVFYCKDLRERATGRRSGCQNHQAGGGCRCKGQITADDPPGPIISERK